MVVELISVYICQFVGQNQPGKALNEVKGKRYHQDYIQRVISIRFPEIRNESREEGQLECSYDAEPYVVNADSAPEPRYARALASAVVDQVDDGVGVEKNEEGNANYHENADHTYYESQDRKNEVCCLELVRVVMMVFILDHS